MAYAILYVRGEKAALEQALETYGATFRQHMNEWLRELASEAESRKYSVSGDVAEAIDWVLETDPGQWAHSLRRIRQGSWRERFRAFLTLLRRRCPPYELRVADRTFEVVDAFSQRIVVFYEVEHPQRRIIIRLFDNLPGRG